MPWKEGRRIESIGHRLRKMPICNRCGYSAHKCRSNVSGISWIQEGLPTCNLYSPFLIRFPTTLFADLVIFQAPIELLEILPILSILSLPVYSSAFMHPGSHFWTGKELSDVSVLLSAYYFLYSCRNP